MLSAFTYIANCRLTVNNEGQGGVRKNLIFFENFIFLLRKSILSPYHSTVNNAEVVSKNVIFHKFGLKFLKNILFLISFYYLVKNAKLFHLIYELLFYR